MKRSFGIRRWVMVSAGVGAVLAVAVIAACSKSSDSGSTETASCTNDDDTTETATTNSYGCAVLTRDTSSCESDRTAQGLSGFWLKFSCRVTLTKSGSSVIIATDSQPDYKSQYYGSSNACYEAFSASDRHTNPNSISAQSISVTVPYAPATATASATPEGVIGVSLNGVGIYDNTAAPGDNIYDESATFDKCQGHPDAMSRYHYHTQPDSISSDDSAFIGVMRDGFPVYGKLDADGTTPTLDSNGGHTSVTADSPSVAVYHYHLNSQTGTDSDGNAASDYFISAGFYNGTPGTCTGCQ